MQIYDRYWDYKIYEFLKARLFPIVNTYRKDEKEEDIYKHIFIAPDAFARRKAFQLQGVIYPYIALWANTQFDWTKGFYSRSAVHTDFTYQTPEGKVGYCSGFYYDLHKEYIIHSSSYFQTFVQSVAMDLLDLDRLRYFDLDCSELLPGFKTRVEFMPKNRSFNSQVDESKSERNFTASFLYDVSVTFPVIDKDKFLDKVELYLNSHKIFESGVEVI